MTRAIRAAAFCLVALAAVPAPSQLSPLVSVLPRPSGPVPADCETGVAAATPRLVLGEPAPAAEMAAPAPPSNEMRAALWRVEAAANGDDYNEFKAALTAARAAAEAFPPGGERDAANDALAVYADIEKLWDYANSTPTGAFFDASTDSLLPMLNRYPGFGHAIADATMATAGTTVYPTREARKFLAAEVTRKLAWMGTAPPPKPVAAPLEPPLVIQPQPAIAMPEPQPERRHALHPAPTAGTPASTPAGPPPSRRRAAAEPAAGTAALRKPQAAPRAKRRAARCSSTVTTPAGGGRTLPGGAQGHVANAFVSVIAGAADPPA